MNDQARFDFEELLLQLREMVETGRSMPMSASVLVNREEVLDILDAMLYRLPEELRQARWLLKEREEFLGKARREADDILEAGRLQAARLVERTELVREARRVADTTVEEADANARALRHEAEDYVDQKLAAFEVVLDRTMQSVQKGRERLQVHVETSPPDEPPTEVEGTEVEDEEQGFFDQEMM
jgi:cell division septum initiation protein DivIVA